MKKVLIVEDHSIVIKGLKIIFEKEFIGYEPHIVSNIAEMMKALKTNEYSLAIVDIQLEDGVSFNILPDMMKLYPSLPVLIFTGYSEELYAQRLFNYGVKGYLNKNSEEREIVYARILLLRVKLISVKIIKTFCWEKMKAPTQQQTLLTYCRSVNWKQHCCSCRENAVRKYVLS